MSPLGFYRFISFGSRITGKTLGYTRLVSLARYDRKKQTMSYRLSGANGVYLVFIFAVLLFWSVAIESRAVFRFTRGIHSATFTAFISVGMTGKDKQCHTERSNFVARLREQGLHCAATSLGEYCISYEFLLHFFRLFPVKHFNGVLVVYERKKKTFRQRLDIFRSFGI